LAPIAAHWIAASTLAFALAASGAAQAQTRATPLPPPRPSTLGQPPQNTTPPGTPAPAPKADEPLDLDHPPMLPSASRKRMSECGHEWQAMKKAGKDVGVGWREFATRCLTR
jgi:hypothetical protein